jgi:osmoprotectant transport system permease protein
MVCCRCREPREASCIDFLEFVADNFDDLTAEFVQHLKLVGVSMAIAIFIALAIGLSVFERDRLAQPILTVSGIILTIPSYAAFAFLLPLTGLGFTSAVIVLIAYAQLPILRNAITGLREIDPAIVESGVGMGMGRTQLLLRVQLPMALPVIMAGVRTATVMIVGIAAIAAVIRAGGLGVFIFRGIARTSNDLVLMGALAIAVIALFIDWVFSLIERYAVSPGLVPRKQAWWRRRHRSAHGEEELS